MEKLFFILITFIGLLFFNCKNNENPDPQPQISYEDINIITGLDFFDDNGNPIGRWKSPNHNPGNVATFPNPNIGIVSLYSQQKIVQIWLIPADCFNDTATNDIPTLSQNLDYGIVEIEEISIKNIPVPDFNNQINLDFSDIATGFYKLFYQLETEEILWQNLYVDPSSTNIPTFGFLDDLCN